MRGLVYLDQNLLSEADEANFVEIFSSLEGKAVRVALSNVHLIEICRSSDPMRFVDRINALHPVIMQTGQTTPSGGFERTIVEIESTSELIREHQENWQTLYFGMIQSHLPILKMLGGAVDLSPEDLLNHFLGCFDESIASLSTQFSEDERTVFDALLAPKLYLSRDEISESFRQIDFDDNMRIATEARKIIALDGGLHQCPTTKLVERVFSLLPEGMRSIADDYPRGLARLQGDVQTNLAALSLALFALGAVPKTRRVLKGAPNDPVGRFYAQILDTHHIGEAAATQLFLTADENCCRLAKAVYAYAGVQTEVCLLKCPQRPS